MSRIFLKIYDFLVRRKALALVILLAAMDLCAVAVLGMHYDEDIYSFLPQNEQTRKYSSVYQRLGGQEKIAVFFRGDDPEAIGEAMDSFGERLLEADTTGMVRDLQVRVDEGAVLDVMSFLRENYPYFLTEKDYARMDSLLSEPGYMEGRLAAAKQTLSLPGASLAAGNLRYDPLNLYSPVFRSLQSLNPAGKGNIVDGHIFLPDGSGAVAFLNSPFGGSESGRNSLLVNLLQNTASETEGDFPSVSVSFTGGPVIAVENASTIKRDSIIAVAVALLLIFALLFLQFRNLRDILWIALTILCGSLFSLGLIAIFKSSISIIILGIGSIIIGIAVNYPLHYVDYLKYDSDTRRALQSIITPLTIGNLTTVLAFLSLVFMRTSALRDFGLVGAMMLVGTIIFTLIFLPVLMPSRRQRSPKALKLRFENRLSEKTRSRLLIPFLLLTAIFAWTGRRTGFDPDMHSINYMTAQQSSDLEALTSLGSREDSTEVIYAVCSAPTLGEALGRNERLLEELGEKYEVNSVSSLIPSEREQQKRIALWKDFWTKHKDIIPEFQKLADAEGFSSKAFRPFLEAIDAEWETQAPEYFSPLSETLCRQFILSDAAPKAQAAEPATKAQTPGAAPEAQTPAASSDAVTLVNYLHVPAAQREAVESEWNSRLAGSDTYFFSAPDLNGQLVGMLSEEFDYIGFVCGLIVFVFLWISFGRLELSILAFLPLAVSWVWILGLMGIFSIDFNIVNVILATFIFGQGDDYTIFITEGLMYEYATKKKILDSYKSSVAFSAMIMFIGIGTLIVARHPAMRSLAEVTIIGMLSVVILAYYLPPLVFRFLTQKKGVRRQCPITLSRLMASLGAELSFFFAFLLFIPWTKLYFLFGKSEERKKRYHRQIHRLTSFLLSHIPGTRLEIRNEAGEDFSRPAVIVCNHQSQLDTILIMTLSDKVVFLTNDWVWNNPVFSPILRAAECYPVSDGLQRNEERIAGLIERGYSIVVFPEGTRSEDCHIQRFHRGAFEIAEKFGLDILPVVIHGFGHIFPKKEFMLRRGTFYAEVLPRIPLSEAGSDVRERTRWFRAFYQREYSRVCAERETAEYFRPYIALQYAYKGKDAEGECRRQLGDLRWVDEIPRSTAQYALDSCGVGAGALALALSHPDTQVYAREADPDKLAIAAACALVPENLHYLDSEGRPYENSTEAE